MISAALEASRLDPSGVLSRTYLAAIVGLGNARNPEASTRRQTPFGSGQVERLAQNTTKDRVLLVYVQFAVGGQYLIGNSPQLGRNNQSIDGNALTDNVLPAIVLKPKESLFAQRIAAGADIVTVTEEMF